jgi:hypothetical protein
VTESPGADLHVDGLRLTRLARQDFSESVSAAQPPVWTIIDFEGDDDIADALAGLARLATSTAAM